jgi:hypothetical protein
MSFMTEYRGDIAEFAEISKKTYAISRFPAKILSVPISPNLPVSSKFLAKKLIISYKNVTLGFS